MATQNQGTQKAPEVKTLTEAEVAERVKAAEAKVREEFEAKLAAASESTETTVSDGDERGEYELMLPVYHEVLSEPGKPLKVREYREGDKLRLTDERAAEFIADKVVKDPNRADTSKAGGQTRAPGSR